MNNLATFWPTQATANFRQRGLSTYIIAPLLRIKTTTITMAPKSSHEGLTTMIIDSINAKELDSKIKGLLVIENLGRVVQEQDKATLLSNC